MLALIIRSQRLCAEETQGGIHEKVIHDRIKLIPLQPALGIPPDFPANVGFRVRAFHHAPKFLPETIVVNFVWHIQPPAVNAEFHPIAGDIQDIIAHARIVSVE